MALIAPINLPYNVRTLWFDPDGIDIKAGDKVVVKTAKGTELGVAASDIIEVEDDSIKKLKSPLKPVIRIATDEDLEKAEKMEQLGREAMPIFKEFARETSEEMHPVSVEYLLDGDKAIFYFESEERIDFRDLVRKLAAHFHVRIDMHQIGVRDEARIVGGIAHCGQEVCCKRMGGEFKPVSIRMAKEQDLSLNPQKISGLCGRLMCCLRYESDTYKDLKSRAPKIGAKIKTPVGEAKVIDLDVPREIVTVQIESEKPVKVELSGFEEAEEGKRPDTITEEGWEIANREEEIVFQSSNIFSTSNFTGEDKLGSAKAVHHPTRSSKAKKSEPKQKKQEPTGKETHRKQRRRRSTVIKGGQSTSVDASEQVRNKQPKQGKSNSKNGSGNKSGSAQKLRPGHRSSGLSASGKSPDITKTKRPRNDNDRKKDQGSQGNTKPSNNKGNDQHRKRRRQGTRINSDKGAR